METAIVYWGIYIQIPVGVWMRDARDPCLQVPAICVHGILHVPQDVVVSQNRGTPQYRP